VHGQRLELDLRTRTYYARLSKLVHGQRLDLDLRTRTYYAKFCKLVHGQRLDLDLRTRTYYARLSNSCMDSVLIWTWAHAHTMPG